MSETRDWSLPRVDEWSSLRPCLHDGVIREISYEPIERTLTLVIEPGFPAPPEGAPESIVVELRAVTHLLCFVDQPWPGGPPRHRPGMSPDEWKAVQGEHRSKSIATTVSIGDFQRLCTEETTEILEAECSKALQPFALDLQGFGSAYAWYRLLVSAGDVRLFVDGKPITWAGFLDLGRSGWEAWSQDG